jgi:hypothetical protein
MPTKGEVIRNAPDIRVEYEEKLSDEPYYVPWTKGQEAGYYILMFFWCLVTIAMVLWWV